MFSTFVTPKCGRLQTSIVQEKIPHFQGGRNLTCHLLRAEVACNPFEDDPYAVGVMIPKVIFETVGLDSEILFVLLLLSFFRCPK